jgi:outer membrane murein-binding lipoprotein Lpp
MMSRYAVLLVACVLAGCATRATAPDPSLALLDRADAHARVEKYRDASALYGEFLQKYGGTAAAPRAEAGQTLASRLLAFQADIDRLQREVAARQGELDRLRGEVARLRSDLERLRGVDLRRDAPR